MKTRTLILAGAGSFLLTSLTQLPASLSTRLLPASLPVQWETVSGSLWHGAASQVRVKGIEVGNLQWDIHGTALLKGRLAARLQGNLAQGGNFSGECSTGWGWQVVCIDTTLGGLPAQTLAPYLRTYLPLPPSGTLQAQLSNLTWQPGTLPLVNGHVAWQDAGVLITPQRFGNYTAILTAGEDNTQQASLASAPDAAFNLSGQVRVQNNGQYQANLVLKPGTGLDNGVRQSLSTFLGPPQADGSYPVEEQGKLPLAPPPP